jgi:ABC-2 type transport system ATP-binding protein
MNEPIGKNEPVIRTQDLTKIYRVPEREPGLRAAARSLIHPTWREVPAVRQVNFSIQPGEMVGLIGENGAGKTTTLKMLCGLLHPSSGLAQVAGFTPWERRPAFLRRISMVLGNKSQMMWDIPPLDTFRVLGEIYAIPRAEVDRRVDELVDMLDLRELLTRPVRNLSLGERMKCELVAGLLHRPEVLFLDEPTLGLDVSVQARLRAFITDYNKRFGATIVLTSHYMADVTALCPRVILIHNGGILYDGALAELAQHLAPFKLIRITFSNGYNNGHKAEPPASFEHELPEGAEILEHIDSGLTLRVNRESAPEATAALLNRLPVLDLAVEDPPIEAVIDRIYREGTV